MYSTVNSIFHISIWINCNWTREGLLYVGCSLSALQKRLLLITKWLYSRHQFLWDIYCLTSQEVMQLTLVCVFPYIYVYIYVCVSLTVHLCTCVCMFVSISLCAAYLYVSLHLYICVYISMCLHLSVCFCVSLCMCSCVSVSLYLCLSVLEVTFYFLTTILLFTSQ
jgi:hypothetical protein